MNEGYFFVPLPDRVNRSQRSHAVLDRRAPGTLSGSLMVTFVAEQPVHVGSGFKALVDETLVRRAVAIRGRPGVPGSSLKGVLRGRYEAITRSCALGEPASPVKVRSQSYPGVNWARFAEGALSHEAFRNRCGNEAMCAACALFGRMSQRSRVTVTDFIVEGEQSFEIDRVPEAFGPNLHHVGEGFEVREDEIRGERRRFFEVRAPKGRKFAAGRGPVVAKPNWQRIEVIPKGSRISGELRVFNVRPEELGGLLAALGQSPKSVLKIGGGKGQGFGRMRLEAHTFRLADPKRNVVTPDESAWRKAFEISADYWKAGEDRLVEIHQGDC